MRASSVAAAANDIAQLKPEFRIMLQATNRSPRRVWGRENAGA